MNPSPPRQPTRAESAKALADTRETMRIREATPLRESFAEALGAPIERNGSEWKIRVTDEKWSPEVNRQRMGLVSEMMRDRRRLQTERSERRAAETESDGVRVRGPQGDVRTIPAYLEPQAAKKEGFRPAPRRAWTTRTVWHSDGTCTEYHRDGSARRFVP